jgi:hypothetical protein
MMAGGDQGGCGERGGARGALIEGYAALGARGRACLGGSEGIGDVDDDFVAGVGAGLAGFGRTPNSKKSRCVLSRFAL